MTAERVLEILDTLRAHGVMASVDGGWGVDALVGRETRPHEDLDLVVAFGDVDAIKSALRALSFSVAEDHLPVRFVMRDTNGSQLDFHAVTFDREGGGVQPQPGGGSFRYPPEGFVRGLIAGQEVPCVSAEVQVLCHLGYEPTAKDAHDVLLLCRHFGLAVPSAYKSFTGPGAA
jgi:lincosamide nucleotidyltransferase A/C/D/E